MNYQFLIDAGSPRVAEYLIDEIGQRLKHANGSRYLEGGGTEATLPYKIQRLKARIGQLGLDETIYPMRRVNGWTVNLGAIAVDSLWYTGITRKSHALEEALIAYGKTEAGRDLLVRDGDEVVGFRAPELSEILEQYDQGELGDDVRLVNPAMQMAALRDYFLHNPETHHTQQQIERNGFGATAAQQDARSDNNN